MSVLYTSWLYISLTYGCRVFVYHSFHCLPVTHMHDCLIVSLRILSGDGDWQVRGVDVEKKRCQDGFLCDAILDVVICSVCCYPPLCWPKSYPRFIASARWPDRSNSRVESPLVPGRNGPDDWFDTSV